MKFMSKIAYVFLTVGLILFVIYFFHYVKPLENHVARLKDNNHSLQSVVDSIQKIARETPDTVRDTTIITKVKEGDQKNEDPGFTEEDTTEYRIYSDSLINEDLKIFTRSRVRGEMDWNSIQYSLYKQRYIEKVRVVNKIGLPYRIRDEPNPQTKDNCFHVIPQLAFANNWGYGVGLMYETPELNYIANYYSMNGWSFVTAGLTIPISGILKTPNILKPF